MLRGEPPQPSRSPNTLHYSTMENHGERKARELGYSHTYKPHNCQHCSCIVLNQADIENFKHLVADQLSSVSNVVLADTLEDAVRARDAGCPLFGYLLGEILDNNTDLSLAILDIDGTGPVYGSFTGQGLRLSHRLGGMALMNMLKVSIQSDDPSASLDCDPGSAEALELSKRWISTCTSSHPLCHMAPLSFKPARLLEVGESAAKLRESREIPGRAQWCALSYVWGGDQSVKTTKASLVAHHNGIALDRLPQALRDAVQVCHGLGVPYLWVDALCIVQDDVGDLRSELSHMPEIYQHAVVTICAASSAKADEGFLFPRGHWYHKCPPVRLQVATELGRQRVAAFAHERRLWENDPISSRAWTYQERVLSPRVLAYRNTVLEWSCRTRVDSYGLLEPTTLLRNSKSKAAPHSFSFSTSTVWSDVVAEYSLRKLTFGADKLRALSAIARVYHRETGKTYLAGLWKEDLPLALCWIPARHSGSPVVPRPSAGSYRAPSWSWASLDSPAMYLAPHPSDEQKTLRPRGDCEVLSAMTTPHFVGGEFDSIASGSLVIRGAAMSLPQGSLSFLLAGGGPEGSEIQVASRHTLVVTLDAADDPGPGPGKLWLLLLAEFFEDDEDEDALPGYFGLVLEEDTGRHDGQLLHRRIGAFQCCDESGFGDGHEMCQGLLGEFKEETFTVI